MIPVSKHGDPQLGVDVHLCTVPPGVPAPLPTPHTSVVFDPFDYVPVLGATVTVCGMKRATAGTSATVIHIPPGFPFAPKLPDSEDEIFMGSCSVVADGEPFSFTSVPTLGCQVAGMISPPRLKKKGPPKAMVLPTTVNLAIPTNVFVGGAPTISLMGMAFKGIFAGLGKFARSGVFRRMRQKLFKNMDSGFLKCTVLRAEPVNILSGEVSVEQEDFVLPGRIPIEWRRTYASGSNRAGICGYGWETPADIRLELDSERDAVLMAQPTGGPLFFDRLPLEQGDKTAELELMDGALLSDQGEEFCVRTKEDRLYRFSKSLKRENAEGRIEYPISGISDLCGNWLKFEYRGPNPVAIQESAGRRIALFTENGRIAKISLGMPDGQEDHCFVRYEYNEAGDLTSVIDALDNPYSFEYDNHHMVRHTDRNGLSFYYEFDKSSEAVWRVIHSWGDGGLYNYLFEYFDDISERRITDSLGNVSVVKLNENGLPISEIDALGGMTIYEYDDVGRTSAVIDQVGNRSEYEYDERGNLLKQVYSDGSSIQKNFSATNKAISLIDANGELWQQKWDARGLLILQISPLGATSRYEYNAYGELAAFINPRGATTALAFDSYGNLKTSNNALGNAIVLDHDLLGNVVGKTDPLARRTAYSYDLKGRLREVALPGGGKIACAYDCEDNLTRYLDENGTVTLLEYFGQGKIYRRIQADGHVVEYQYNTEEQLVGVNNQRGENYQIKRDALGRIVEEIDYWGQSRHYAYDANGYLSASVDPLGNSIKYSTDPFGRILRKTSPEGIVENFVYDANGNLIQADNQHGTIKREFDSEHRLIEEVQGRFSIKNTYDANGNRIARVTSLGSTVNYEYDALDQSVTVSINQMEPILIERDPVGRIMQESLNSKLSRRFSYSTDGYLIKQAITANESPLFSTHFEYDMAGNLSQRSDEQYGGDVFHYDPLGRIIEHIDPQSRLTSHCNDPAGDRLTTRIVDGTRTRVVGGSDVENDWSREGEYEGIQYCFDRAGNLIERRGRRSDLHLVWDSNQRLIESYADGVKTRYGYDPLGRRLFKETGNIRTQFYWDGDALSGESVVLLEPLEEIQSRIESNVFNLNKQREKAESVLPKKLREYIYYSQTFEPLACLDGLVDGQQVYYFHNDPNGSPTRLTDGSGKVKWGVGYTAWGGIAKLHVCEIDNPIRLQGQYADEELGLHYNRYRYDDPHLGSFISQDPLRLMVGPNLYWYAGNRSFLTDPVGLSCTFDVNAGRWRNRQSGRFQAAPTDFSDLVHNGRIDYNDVRAFATHHGLPNNWVPSANFPAGGFRHQTATATHNISAHGHGINPNAVANFPGSNAATGPTASIRRQPVGGGAAENFRTDGTWGSFGSDPNGAHIPMDNSPY